PRSGLHTIAQGDFGPVVMTQDRSTPGILRIDIKGEGGHVDAAYRRWIHNLALAKDAGLHRILVVLELSGKVIPEADLAAMIRKVASLDIAGFRVAVVQTRHERQHQDEVGILLAMEYGITARVFPDEASALLWLRHGSA
ncbi:MAG: hypothetical protein JWL98_1483, partial [Xanthomonadaceae bacterium]|nr:hypothetical protein [Xanthomonadaceae bacterium]